MEEKVVMVGERRISAEFASNLANVLPGDFAILGETIKDGEDGIQSWLRIKLSDGQVLMIASGDLLDAHMKGGKIFGEEPVVGTICSLREGLKIGVKAKRVTFA